MYTHQEDKRTSIADWPEDERPLERLLTRGAHALTDAALLAILRLGVQGKRATKLARKLLQHFGSQEMSTPLEAQDGIRGWGKVRAAWSGAVLLLDKQVTAYRFELDAKRVESR